MCTWGKGVCNVCVHGVRVYVMCVYMGICTLMLDPGPVMFLGPGTDTSRV